MADEAVFSPVNMLRLVRIAGADMASIKLMRHGGFGRVREVAGIPAAAGVRISRFSPTARKQRVDRDA